MGLNASEGVRLRSETLRFFGHLKMLHASGFARTNNSVWLLCSETQWVLIDAPINRIRQMLHNAPRHRFSSR